LQGILTKKKLLILVFGVGLVRFVTSFPSNTKKEDISGSREISFYDALAPWMQKLRVSLVPVKQE